MSWRLYILKLINERHILHTEHKNFLLGPCICYIIMVSFNNLIAKISLNSFIFEEQLCDKGYVLYPNLAHSKMRAIFPQPPRQQVSLCAWILMNEQDRKERKGSLMSILFPFSSPTGQDADMVVSYLGVCGWRRRHKAERAWATVDFLGLIHQNSFDFYMRNKETPALFRHCYFVLVLFVFLDTVILDHCYRESKLIVTSLIF